MSNQTPFKTISTEFDMTSRISPLPRRGDGSPYGWGDRSGDCRGDSSGNCPGNCWGNCRGNSQGDCWGDCQGDCQGNCWADCQGNCRGNGWGDCWGNAVRDGVRVTFRAFCASKNRGLREQAGLARRPGLRQSGANEYYGFADRGNTRKGGMMPSYPVPPPDGAVRWAKYPGLWPGKPRRRRGGGE